MPKHRTPTLRSKIILGASPHPDTEQRLRIQGGYPPDAILSMHVFEVEIDNTIRYCCWSGGTLIADPAGFNVASGGPPRAAPHLTLAGQAACEALLRLPYLYDRDGRFKCVLVFHGIARGKTPLRDKVMTAFRMSADVKAVICFVGDLAGELDGHMGKTFNLDGVVSINEIRGMG
jgi:hypothetical protein